MTSRDLVISALNRCPVDRTPRDIWLAADVAATRADDVAEMNVRFPSDIIHPEFEHPGGKRSHGKPGEAGFVDAWGCRPGEPDEQAPLADAAKIAGYQPPQELLVPEHFAKVNRACVATRFVLAMSDVRPFERLQALRGSRAAIADLQRGAKEPLGLLKMVHEFACKEMELWAKTDVDGVAFRDVWGSNDSLLIPPALWREHFKPLYEDYCKILHAHDKFAFFVSGGKIVDIMSDLAKIEVDAIHSRWASMDLERLAKRFAGKITFWGGLDRDEILRTGAPKEIRDAVMRVRTALEMGEGGVIAQCRWEPAISLQAMVTFCEQWMMPLPQPSPA